MKICVINAHLPNYQQLAELTTYGNRADYCHRHGYELKVQTDGFTGGMQHPVSWDRFRFMRDTLAGGFDWAWCSGTDTLNTNFNIRLEDLIDENFHVIASAEWCSPFQADSFLVRNSPEGLGWMDTILSMFDKYKTHTWVEQQAIIDTLPDFKGIVKLLPQRAMNSYDYWLYREKYPKENRVYSGVDIFGNDGQWRTGDFLIHWPGLPLEQRMELVKKYLPFVVK
jgi:hypothetical protein